jgi:hypothetical protein
MKLEGICNAIVLTRENIATQHCQRKFQGPVIRQREKGEENLGKASLLWFLWGERSDAG